MRELIFATGPQGLGRRGGELRQRFGLHLSGVLGERVEIYPCESYSQLSRAVRRGTVAMAWLAPALFVDAHEHESVRLLARSVRHGSNAYRGAVFVRASSNIREVVGLHGATMGWVDPDSCAGHLFPRHALTEAGFDPDAHLGEQRFLGSHTAVARAVAAGDVDAGAGYVHLSDDGAILHAGWDMAPGEFRRLVTSGDVPSDTICATRSLDDDLLPRARAALSSLGETAEGRALLVGLFQCVGFEEAEGEPTDYDAVKRVREGIRRRG